MPQASKALYNKQDLCQHHRTHEEWKLREGEKGTCPQTTNKLVKNGIAQVSFRCLPFGIAFRVFIWFRGNTSLGALQ